MDHSAIHAGHRGRVKKKFIENGLDGFELHEALEMYLFYGVARKDTNALAHKLINDLGSLSAVFDAPIEQLKSEGISENVAVLLKLLPEMARIYLDDKYNNRSKVINFDRAGEYMVNKFIGRQDECFALLLTDAKRKKLFSGIIAKGSINTVEIPCSKIVDYAMRYHAKYAIIAHNHPSGIAEPSEADAQFTRSLDSLLTSIGVELIDHYIVADGEYAALSQSKDCFPNR